MVEKNFNETIAHIQNYEIVQMTEKYIDCIK